MKFLYLSISIFYLLNCQWINCAALASSYGPTDIFEKVFWSTLSSSLHIVDESYIQSGSIQGVLPEEVEIIQHLMKDEGYVELQPLIFGDIKFSELTDLMDKLHRLKLPMAFVYIYDEFWLLFFRLHRVIESIIGENYFRLPDMWAWRIDPAVVDRGWSLHRDKNQDTIRSNGLPETLTIWLPLSDTTTLNGCMYLLPANRDPTYRNLNDSLLNTTHWPHIVAEIRALPVKAGQPLIWNQMIWHYGSRSSARALHPRYSVSIEYQAGNISKIFNSPLQNPLWFPDFEYRVQLIGKVLSQYLQFASPTDRKTFLFISEEIKKKMGSL